MRFFSSIRTKTSLLFIVLFVLIVLPVNWIIYQKIKTVLKEASYREMKWEAEKLLNDVKLDPLIVPLTGRYEIKLTFHNNLIDEVIFSSPTFPDAVENSLLRYYQVDTLELVNVAKPISSSSGELMLTLARNSTPLLSQLSEVQIYLFFISTASLLLAALLAYPAAGWMLKPFSQIASAASRIKASESIIRIPVPDTGDESQRLGEALNDMLARIERTIKNQANFFASATHELKTPLAIMKVELGSMGANHKMKGFAAEIERLDHVISDFLLISQLKSESLTIRKNPEAIEEIVYRSLQKIQYMKEQYQPTIQVNIAETNPDFIANIDADKLETVFINLFENAVKYSEPKKLSILLAGSPDAVRIVVLNPVSEPVRNLETLTNEFTKSKELSGGLGMGLWICNEILKKHDGYLEVSEENQVFKADVTLPKN